MPIFLLAIVMYGLAFVLSFAFALYLTPLMRRAALELNIVDNPDGRLKNHETAVPYFGGLAVYSAFLLTVGVVTDFGPETLGLLLSGSIMLMVGLIDDFGVLTPKQKLVGQTLAAVVLIKSGTFIKLEFIPQPIAIVLTLLWILAVTNALNIIDILDGLASGVAGIAALSIAIANLAAGRSSIAILCVVLAGACFGFLRHNFHPARIYLGDAGSLFIGFMLATLSLNAGYTRVNILAVISPVLILGIPLFDLALVMLIRRRKGIPMMKGSPDHFALRLRRCKLSVRETAIVTYVVGILLGSLALLIGQVTLGWAIVTLAGTLSLAGVFAYLLMKVDMTT
jgi:UDP-GlcNAc:undecaprenyl-phosphate/decaprenyl-phosphate GlcNAc-1-phosphate transferase